MTRIGKLTAQLLFLATLAACQAAQDDIDAGPAADCLVQASANNGQPIAGQFIVTIEAPSSVGQSNARRATQAQAEAFLRDHQVNNPTADLLTAAQGEATFVAQLNPDEANNLRTDPATRLLEPDRLVSICNCVELVAPRTLTWNVQQTGYGRGDNQTGKTVWVIDTGIDLDHPDLNVDTDRSRSFISNSTTADDLNGHGTHVAGIIGALNNNVGTTGVASGARLVALKVLNQLGEGRLSGVITAVNHVLQNGRSGDVVNLSLGSEGNSPTLERAMRQAADRGILFAVAAGNDGESTENQTPARVNHPNIFTVAAIDRTDQLANFSNYGPSVDVAAYGVRITSTYTNARYATLSGTSMAAPHVAGLLFIRGGNVPRRGTVLDSRSNQTIPIARE